MFPKNILRHQLGIVDHKRCLNIEIQFISSTINTCSPKIRAIRRVEHRVRIPKPYAKHLEAYIRHQMMGEVMHEA